MSIRNLLEGYKEAEWVVVDCETFFYASRTKNDMPDLPTGETFNNALRAWEKEIGHEVKYKWHLSDVLREHVRAWDGYCFAVGFGAIGVEPVIWTELNESCVSRQDVGGFLLGVLRSSPVVMHNSAFDTRILKKNFGIPISEYRELHDSMLLHNVLYSEMKHDLNHLSAIYSSQNRHKFLGTHSETYLLGDVVTTLEVWYNLLGVAKKDPQSWKIYTELQLPMLPHILKAHERGIRINKPFHAKMEKTLERQREIAQETANDFVGSFVLDGDTEPDSERTINLNSSPQKSKWVYGHCGLKIPGLRKGKSGAYPLRKDQVSTLQDMFFIRDDDDTFESRLKNGGHPLVESIAEYTQADKFLSSFITPYHGTDRMYPNFKLHGQATGRWSTTGPNLPGMNKALKPLCIPDIGEDWVGGDWSNAELRIMGELSNDPLFKKGFSLGWDLHSMHASQAFGWDSPKGRWEWAVQAGKIARDTWEDFKDTERGEWWGCVPPGEWKDTRIPADHDWLEWILSGGPQPGWLADEDLFRRFCKILVFRLCYGGSPKTASKIPGALSLGLIPSRLVEASNMLIAAHPSWTDYWEDMGGKAIRDRIVRNPNGRARRLMDKDENSRFRKGVNFPIQSWVSDLLNRTLIGILDECPWARLCYTCHDSFYVGCPKDHTEELAEVVMRHATTPLRDDFFIPFDMEKITYDEDTQVRTVWDWKGDQWLEKMKK